MEPAGGRNVSSWMHQEDNVADVGAGEDRETIWKRPGLRIGLSIGGRQESNRCSTAIVRGVSKSRLCHLLVCHLACSEPNVTSTRQTRQREDKIYT